mmetsp:Transcript_18757/g.45284  ORF Transcript_18757/g.45284 Transcript_18757/m.45284 type:complete len:135 (-) Transcript_18757:1140-1544(-)
MKTYQIIIAFLAMAVSVTSAFTTVPTSFNSQAGSGFVVSQRPQQQSTISAPSRPRTGTSSLQMGNVAKFGVFSPAVYAAKVVLGGEKLNKIRGKAISLHSQYIGEFCQWAGAYHLRTQLIKKAKKNGDTLGFLV